jgi:prolipoprotein diacylglyceryltransferase
MAVVGMLYGLGRFGFEYIRDEPDRGEMFGFSVAQIGSIVLAATCALVYSSRGARTAATQR